MTVAARANTGGPAGAIAALVTGAYAPERSGIRALSPPFRQVQAQGSLAFQMGPLGVAAPQCSRPAPDANISGQAHGSAAAQRRLATAKAPTSDRERVIDAGYPSVRRDSRTDTRRRTRDA